METINYIIDDKTMCIPHNFIGKINLCSKALRHVDTLIFEEDLSKNIKSMFNRSIVLTPNMKVLIFGHKFNKQIVLPEHIVVLTFGFDFNCPIVLTKTIVELTFGERFNKPIVLTRYIRVLKFSCAFNKQFGLILDPSFNKPSILTPNIEVLTFGYYFNRPIILTPRLRVLIFGQNFNRPIVLTKNITLLRFGFNFVQPIILTKYITSVVFGMWDNSKHSIVLTSNVQHLALESECGHSAVHVLDNLLNGIKYVSLGKDFRFPLNNIPNHVLEIITDYKL